tara:strand:- start:867 stop:1718 length:852 start_codon:yes stop_codon:yes gene_type:complete
MNHCNNIILIILLIFLFIIFTKKSKFIGGSDDNTKTNKNNSDLEDMIKNNDLNDNQKLELLKNERTKYGDLVKKNTRLYNNLLTNLNSTDDEIDIAELDLEDSKNQLLLAEINVNLKESIINKKNNKDKSKNKILDFYVKLNTVKQYNIYSMILMSKVRKIRKNTIVSPNDELFKKKLIDIINKTVSYTKITYNKTNDLYKLSISTDNVEINSYKSDLSNSKILANNLNNNIINIQSRLNKKHDLDKQIKRKLSEKKKPVINEITENKETSLFDNLSALFTSF